MSSVLPLIAVIVTVIAGWALIKRVQTHMVLLFAGLAILICVALAGTGFLPKGVKPSGFWLFDIFATLKSIATKQSSGIGFLIMTAGGFAAYMDRIGAAKALGAELASRGITVNVVAPGLINTEMTTDADRDRITPLIPMGRIGEPEEVAAVVKFLLSPEAAYVTRAVIPVSGGL